ncbi:hypothetical protein GDO81_030156 [Engystomops pustulosus]|uniref:Secreted protein n=1 Tax=Engystomops pustulosus TaxID=76066 RepID=A0AAV6YCQ1_ENGPU|nr:hypothetical protein GDO81_030156 [Engystomops pustulosus]
MGIHIFHLESWSAAIFLLLFCQGSGICTKVLLLQVLLFSVLYIHDITLPYITWAAGCYRSCTDVTTRSLHFSPWSQASRSLVTCGHIFLWVSSSL